MEESIYKMVEENNDMLKKLLKKGRWTIVFRTIKYIIILILIFGSYYYAKPYIDKTRELYIKVNETTDSIGELKDKANDAFDFKKIFEN